MIFKFWRPVSEVCVTQVSNLFDVSIIAIINIKSNQTRSRETQNQSVRESERLFALSLHESREEVEQAICELAVCKWTSGHQKAAQVWLMERSIYEPTRTALAICNNHASSRLSAKLLSSSLDGDDDDQPRGHKRTWVGFWLHHAALSLPCNQSHTYLLDTQLLHTSSLLNMLPDWLSLSLPLPEALLIFKTPGALNIDDSKSRYMPITFQLKSDKGAHDLLINILWEAHNEQWALIEQSAASEPLPNRQTLSLPPASERVRD